MEHLALVIKYDEQFRYVLALLDTSVEKDYKDKIVALDLFSKQLKDHGNDQENMKKKMEDMRIQCDRLMHKLKTSSKLLDEANKEKRHVEFERDALTRQLGELYKVFNKANPSNNPNGSIMFEYDKIRFDQMPRHDTTESILSDISYSRSEDSLDSENNFEEALKRREQELVGTVKRKRLSVQGNNMGALKEIETITSMSNQVVATTTVTMNQQNGNISAKSIIESKPSNTFPIPSAPPISDSLDSFDSEACSDENNQNAPNTIHSSSALNKLNNRAHNFTQKNIIIPEVCGPCGKKVKFNKVVVKCLDCKAVAHLEHKDKIPLPCIPVKNTPNKNGGRIADYSPMVNGRPMVPALVIHCVNEIEQRGFDTVGLYRVPGSEKDVKALKEKFRKGVPNLSDIDIHVICGCLKDFLRTLDDPLIPHYDWKTFTDAVRNSKDENEHRLYQAISQLPQPNRNTLAYLMLHLQKVAASPDCKMPIGNLARMFGPTIVGYSSESSENMYFDCELSNRVVEEMLKLSPDYWSNFLNNLVPRRVQNNPVKRTPSRPLQPTHTPISRNNRIFGSSTKRRYLESPRSVKAARIKQLESKKK
ncbi:rac GTPase-activating protein 1-like [Daktulosphaira vitifoliae]|uniref:rac GTPase-activating protein 1-like n=1 Tax=Daktulosphaira vitifoliae TaxID=58002 RepID=UPI0021A9AFA9|nr:rac GTPase-activating protein 1-like [Daktulosphaira vitifoliae]XP_050545729.1 rac GTPase-activating protein 1-like [Daktulosphaira vitifoliae]